LLRRVTLKLVLDGGARTRGREGVLVLAIAVGCGAVPREGSPPREPLPSPHRASETHGAEDLMSGGARLVPGRLDSAQIWGPAPGGGLRAVVGGVRIVARPDGTISVASGRLTAGAWRALELPERFGTGFLFSSGPYLWRAESWLSDLVPLAAGSAPIDQLMLGLDRIYLRYSGKSLAAIDPRDGRVLDRGPLPAATGFVSIAALDAWRAMAVTDLSGILLTQDAGVTWHAALHPPFEPLDALVRDGQWWLATRPSPGRLAWWRADSDFAMTPVPDESAPGYAPPHWSSSESADPILAGARALRLAVADGWPLADGTALTARDGALLRIRLTDGAVVRREEHAFAMNPARCHPFALPSPIDPHRFGYTCAEPLGPTTLYVWDGALSKMVELRRFAEPRQVDAFGNGALAVRGECASHGRVGDASWCVLSPNGSWHEIAASTADARPVALADGTTALVAPPVDGDLSTARLAVSGGSRARSLSLSFPALTPETERVLRFGVWMDGLEERRAGVLGGWIDLAGSVLGIEIALDGHVRVGEYISDAGAPVVGGRWGFGWTASRRGFETTDGGMTWNKGLSLPDPLAEPPADREHVCGALGCLVAGWTRIGWGGEPSAALGADPPRLPHPRAVSSPPVALHCAPLADRGGLGAIAAEAAALASPGEDLARFASLAPSAEPRVPSGEVGISADPSSSFDSFTRTAHLARAFAWGSPGDDWEATSRLELQWIWPWGRTPEVGSSLPAPARWSSLDAARSTMRSLGGAQSGWTVVPGDGDHALLVARDGPGPSVALLETGRAPQWIHESGAHFDRVEAATRAGGRWIVATAQRPDEPAASVLWALDSSGTRELARLPRAGDEPYPRIRLARRNDDRAVGVIVAGQPDLTRDASLWVIRVDLESGALSDPEPLASLEMSPGGVRACEGDEPGWTLDWPYPASVDVHVGTEWSATLAGATARVRLSAAAACLEGIAGSADREAAHAPEALYRPHAAATLGSGTRVRVLVVSARAHFPLHCTVE
jgi:hypothetical protein